MTLALSNAVSRVTADDLRAWVYRAQPVQRRPQRVRPAVREDRRPPAPTRTAGGLWIDPVGAPTTVGVPAGTWIAVRLVHGAASSDPGWTTFRTTRAVIGRDGVLPVGTLLFATKQFNPVARRLEFSATKIVLADGKTIKIQGLVCDLAHRPGLPVFMGRSARVAHPWRRWLRPLTTDIQRTRAFSWLRQGVRVARQRSVAVDAYAGPQPARVEILRGF